VGIKSCSLLREEKTGEGEKLQNVMKNLSKREGGKAKKWKYNALMPNKITQSRTNGGRDK